MISYQKYKNEALKDPEVRKEYNALEPEMDAIQLSLNSVHKSLEERSAEYGGNLHLDGELNWGEQKGREKW